MGKHCPFQVHNEDLSTNSHSPSICTVQTEHKPLSNLGTQSRLKHGESSSISDAQCRSKHGQQLSISDARCCLKHRQSSQMHCGSGKDPQAQPGPQGRLEHCVGLWWAAIVHFRCTSAAYSMGSRPKYTMEVERTHTRSQFQSSSIADAWAAVSGALWRWIYSTSAAWRMEAVVIQLLLWYSNAYSKLCFAFPEPHYFGQHKRNKERNGKPGVRTKKCNQNMIAGTNRLWPGPSSLLSI
eukprot:scaffold132832_cov17-Tisochrysis_lutea.AAC.2